MLITSGVGTAVVIPGESHLSFFRLRFVGFNGGNQGGESTGGLRLGVGKSKRFDFFFFLLVFAFFGFFLGRGEARSDVVVVGGGDGASGEGYERSSHGAGLDFEHGHLRLRQLRPLVSTMDELVVLDTISFVFLFLAVICFGWSSNFASFCQGFYSWMVYCHGVSDCGLNSQA